MTPQINGYSPTFNFSPVNVFKEYKGKKYRYMGEYHQDPYLISVLRKTLNEARYSIKIEQKPGFFVVWGRER